MAVNRREFDDIAAWGWRVLCVRVCVRVLDCLVCLCVFFGVAQTILPACCRVCVVYSAWTVLLHPARASTIVEAVICCCLLFDMVMLMVLMVMMMMMMMMKMMVVVAVRLEKTRRVRVASCRLCLLLLLLLLPAARCRCFSAPLQAHDAIIASSGIVNTALYIYGCVLAAGCGGGAAGDDHQKKAVAARRESEKSWCVRCMQSGLAAA
jgi:hypothetical protein